MLVITRRVGERLFIGDDIVIQVLNNGDNYRQIKLGIEAPRDVSVYREEIYDKIQREQSGLAISKTDYKNKYNNEDWGNR